MLSPGPATWMSKSHATHRYANIPKLRVLHSAQGIGTGSQGSCCRWASVGSSRLTSVQPILQDQEPTVPSVLIERLRVARALLASWKGGIRLGFAGDEAWEHWQTAETPLVTYTPTASCIPLEMICGISHQTFQKHGKQR